VPYLLNLGEVSGDHRSIGQLLEAFPAAFAFAPVHLHARYVLAKLGLRRGAFSSLTVLPNRIASKLILDHFTMKIAQTGKGERALQVMHAQDLIATLPSGITAIPRPSHRQRYGTSLPGATAR
jgi:hypothetical protein